MPKVLLIEENPKLADMIGKFLQKKGLSSEIAPDAVSAVRAFAGADFSLLLVDRELQKIDGESLCRRIRESAKGKEIPIIMMSGSVKEPSHIEGLKKELRLSGFLTKPFSAEALFGLISSTLHYPDAPAKAPQPTARKNIKGDLRQVPFEQVLLYLLTKRGTGILTLTWGAVERKIVFVDGAAADVQPSLDEDDFGNYLAAKNLVSAAELREYEDRRKKEAEDSRDLFVKMGCLTPQQLREECANFLRNRLIECFSWRTGTCSFEWLPSFMKSIPAARALMPSLFFHGFKTHLPPVSISDFLAEKGGLYVDKTAEFYEYQNHLAAEPAGAELLDLIDGLKTGYQIMDSAVSDDAATILYTLDYLRLFSYSAAPKKSEVAAPFPIREREAVPRAREEEKFEDLGGELRELSDELGGLVDLNGSPAAAGHEGLTALEEDLKKKWDDIKTKNYYELFGMTQSTFSFDKAKKSYFEYTRTYGPEKFFASSGEVMGLAEELLSKISNAYETLTNVVSKENYDELISSQEQAPTREEDKEFYEKVQFQSGRVLLEQGQCESAEKAFTNCMNIDPDKPEYYAYLALAVYNNTANKGSAAAVKRAKDLVNNSLKLGKLSIAYALKGTMLLDEGSLNFAEAEFNKALKLNPNNKTALKKMEFIKAQREGEKKGLFQRLFK